MGYHEETEEILKKLRAQLREKRKITKDIFISDNSKIIEAIRNLLKSSAPDRSLKLQNIIKNRYFNNYIRSSALKALREFKDSSNKDFLIGLLNDPNENLKEEIISVLAAFGDKSVYSILNKILVNTNEKMELRIAAA
ncbi:MAG TPA: HEAT repeat domain-containing protein, partial [bacterium]|nr:HEAT repeat domain-containing protein [bacterium]